MPRKKSRSSDDVLSWLKDVVGIPEYRRVVHEGESAIVLSKFDPGFSAGLFDTVDDLPEMFDTAQVRAEYARLAAEAGSAGTLRTALWRAACEAVVGRAASEHAIPEERLELIIPGLESVQAVLDTALWSAPKVGDEGYVPQPGEKAAFEEVIARMPEHDLFTRYYGAFDGKRVENYCPGSQFARRLLQQGWDVCTAGA